MSTSYVRMVFWATLLLSNHAAPARVRRNRANNQRIYLVSISIKLIDLYQFAISTEFLQGE